MKTILLLLLATPFLFVACKKDKAPAKNLYLSKVYEDGLLKTEYIYSADKKPIRRNNYSTNTGQSVFGGFQLFEYNANGLVESMTLFGKTNVFNTKYKLQYDLNKRVTRMDDLANDNSLQFYYVFDYNANGGLSNFTLFTAVNKKTADGVLTYNAQQRLTKFIRRSYISNPSFLIDSSTFTFNSKSLPNHWNYFEQNLVVALPNGDRTFVDMVCDSSFNYAPDTPPRTITVTLSSKQYNQAGYIIKQQGSRKSDGFGGGVISNYEMTYEYIE